MQHKIFSFLHGIFGKLTERSIKGFLLKRLPLYVAAVLILWIWGVGGLMMTFLFVMTFVFGFWMNKTISLVKDYRMTLRLNRVHFNEVDYMTMKRERDAALEAIKMMGDERGRGVKGAPKPPRPFGPQTTARHLDPDEIMEFMREHAIDGRP